MAKLNSLSDLKSLFPEAKGSYQPEIKPKKHPNFFQHISKIKKLDFNLIEAREVKNKDESGDIFLNTADLKNFL